jgi:Copper amine oxidase N-terminal domain.
MKINKFLCVLLTLTIAFGAFTISVIAEDNIKVLLNGKELSFDVPPQLIDDRTMVPMRVIFEALGADVYWDVFEEWDVEGYEPIQMITVVKNEIKILMTVNQPDMLKFVGDIDDEFADFWHKIESIELDVPPQVIDGRTLVPVRAISEALGIDVDWNNDTSTVILSCDDEFIENENTDKDFYGGLIDFFNKMIADEFADTQSADVTEITVSTADEFVAALGSNRKILLESGIYNLSLTNQRYSLTNPYNSVYWREVYDGNELCLNWIENLTIEGIGDVTIVVEPRYAFVLNFEGCADITISNITAGHTDSGYCEGGVFYFDYCFDIKMDNTHMYGCGTEGLLLEWTSNMDVTNSTIYECTYDIMTIKGCKNIFFDNCVFRDNEMFDLVNISHTSNLTINNSEFRNNNANVLEYSTYAMFYVYSSENINITNTKFIDNTAWIFSETDNINLENNTFEDNNFTNDFHPRHSYPEVDDLSEDELSVYGISLYMTIEDVVSLIGKPLSERVGQFRNHYPLTILRLLGIISVR